MNNEKNKEYMEGDILENWITSISNLAISFSGILRSQNQKIIASSSMRYGKLLVYLSYDVLRSQKDPMLPVFNPNVLDCFKQDFIVIAFKHNSYGLKEENADVLIKFNQNFINLLKKCYLYFELSGSLERYGKAWYFIGGILNFGNRLQISNMFYAVENFNFNFQFHSKEDDDYYIHIKKLIHSLEEVAPPTVKLFFEGKI
jgi:hypothetical protein